MGRLDGVDDAGRQIAGLLGYNPGPGIYSRLERAVEGLPANVRVQELPGLLKRYKEGVPGWELRATDLDSTIAGRDVVPRDELLAAVRERSPVYTHREIVLGGNPPQQIHGTKDANSGIVWEEANRVYQDSPSQLGRGISHGAPRFERFGQEGANYAELLFVDPAGPSKLLSDQRHHFSRNYPNPHAPLPFYASEEVRDAATKGTVAHLRFDTHGDALRLNELQSDLANHNIQRRKLGMDPLPFAAQEAVRDLGLKRFLLQGARDGGVIEIASPESISEAVNMPLEHARHLYGKVYPSDLERFARPLGGMTEEVPRNIAAEPVRRGNWHAVDGINNAITQAAEEAENYANGLVGRGSASRSDGLGPAIADLVWEIHSRQSPRLTANEIYQSMLGSALQNGWPGEAARTLVGNFMPDLMRRAERMASMYDARRALYAADPELRSQIAGPSMTPMRAPPVAGRRWRMSDAMRRNLIEKGVGASLLAPLLMQGGE